MRPICPAYYHVVAAFSHATITIFFIAATSFAAIAEETSDLDAMFLELQTSEDESWRIAESDILREWSKSGSAAMDLLLQRGEQALDEGDIEAAIGHLTALTDHAPDFATGWQARAAAYSAAGMYGPAAADLARALTLEPRQFAALTQLGEMLEDMGDTDAALQAYRESLKIHPHQDAAIDGVERLESEDQGTDI